MDELHKYVGYLVPGGFALLTLWAIASFVRNKAPGDGFWNLLGAIQVILGIQVVVGVVLLLMGSTPPPQPRVWLHYVYGSAFPILVLFVAHRYARRSEGLASIIFGVAAFVNFGLTSRALMTGLGIGVG